MKSPLLRRCFLAPPQHSPPSKNPLPLTKVHAWPYQAIFCKEPPTSPELVYGASPNRHFLFFSAPQRRPCLFYEGAAKVATFNNKTCLLRDITSMHARMSGGERQLGKSLYNNAFTSHPLCFHRHQAAKRAKGIRKIK